MGQAQSTDTLNLDVYNTKPTITTQTTTLAPQGKIQSQAQVIPNKGYEIVNSTTNSTNSNNNPINKPKYKAVLTTSMLIDAFRLFSIDGKYLNHTRFNDTIEKLFSRLDIPCMHYTYLSEKIYTLLDESRDGKISEDEYINGMKNVMNNPEFRLKCKFFHCYLNI